MLWLCSYYFLCRERSLVCRNGFLKNDQCGWTPESSEIADSFVGHKVFASEALLRFLEEPDVLVVPPLSWTCLEYSMLSRRRAHSIDHWNSSNPIRPTRATCGSIFWVRCVWEVWFWEAYVKTECTGWSLNVTYPFAKADGPLSKLSLMNCCCRILRSLTKYTYFPFQVFFANVQYSYEKGKTYSPSNVLDDLVLYLGKWAILFSMFIVLHFATWLIQWYHFLYEGMISSWRIFSVPTCIIFWNSTYGYGSEPTIQKWAGKHPNKH